MPKPDRFFTATFRLTLLTAPLFLAAGWALLAVVFVGTRTIMEHRVDVGLVAESERIATEFQSADRAALVQAIGDRIFAERGSSRLYRVREADGRDLVDNFALVGGRLPPVGGFSDVTMKRGPSDVDHAARLSAVALPDGLTLFIGRDLTEEDELRRIVRDTVLAGAAAMALLALVAGAITSRAVVRRLAGFNASAARILHGHLDERMPVTGGGDEFDHLGETLNEALDRIADLMAATRHVTDNIAHDLRGPLSRVRGRLELLQIAETTPETVADALAESVGDLDVLLETLESLLAIARIDHGGPTSFAPVAVARLVDDLVDYYRPLAEEKALALDLAVTGDPMVEGDRHLLFQALSNIVDNAVRHTPAGGTIRVSASRRGDRVEIVVADDGPGIPASERQRVLGRFVRLDASRHLPGSGLGLAVVDAVVRHHGATLTLGDARPGLVVTLSFAAFSEGAHGET